MGDGDEGETPYDFYGTIIHETDKAWLFRNGITDEEVWLPKSRCHWDGSQIMTVPEWLAKAKDLM